MIITRTYPIAVLLLMLGTCASCSHEPAPVGVTGLVTIDGAPVSEGHVRFEPTSDAAGQSRNAQIESGRFALPADEGLLPGLDFRVRIKAFRKTGRKYPNADMSASYDEVEQYLPEQYNGASTLQVTTSADEQQNHFEFHLMSDAS